MDRRSVQYGLFALGLRSAYISSDVQCRCIYRYIYYGIHLRIRCKYCFIVVFFVCILYTTFFFFIVCLFYLRYIYIYMYVCISHDEHVYCRLYSISTGLFPRIPFASGRSWISASHAAMRWWRSWKWERLHRRWPACWTRDLRTFGSLPRGARAVRRLAIWRFFRWRAAQRWVMAFDIPNGKSTSTGQSIENMFYFLGVP